RRRGRRPRAPRAGGARAQCGARCPIDSTSDGRCSCGDFRRSQGDVLRLFCQSMSNTRQSTPIPVVPRALARPLEGLAADYEPGAVIPLHQHPFAQLLFASSGVMTVTTEHGTWVVPPERAVWVPARVGHSIRMTGRVSMRTL